MPAPSIFTLPRVGATASTRPRFPLSRPAIRTTWSFFLIFARLLAFTLFSPGARASNYFRRQRNYLHVILVAQLARDRTKHARPDWRAIFFNQHGGILIETNVGAVATTDFFPRSHNHGILDSALLDRAIRRSFLHSNLDSIAKTRNRTGRAADAHNHFDPPRS